MYKASEQNLKFNYLGCKIVCNKYNYTNMKICKSENLCVTIRRTLLGKAQK
jgi:hypothetical protein